MVVVTAQWCELHGSLEVYLKWLFTTFVIGWHNGNDLWKVDGTLLIRCSGVIELLLLNVHGGEKAYQGLGRMEKGGQKNETSKQAPTWKTQAAVDHSQNNRMLRQCPSGIAQ